MNRALDALFESVEDAHACSGAPDAAAMILLLFLALCTYTYLASTSGPSAADARPRAARGIPR